MNPTDKSSSLHNDYERSGSEERFIGEHRQRKVPRRPREDPLLQDSLLPYASPARRYHEDVPHLEESESSGMNFVDDNDEKEVFHKIQVADGLYMRLRGSKETQAAFDNGLCIEATCYACDIILACIRDCDCVICPQCRMVSPVEQVPRIGSVGASRHVGGVGLGVML